MKQEAVLTLQNPLEFKQKALLWANKFNAFVCLDSNASMDAYRQHNFLLAVDAVNHVHFQNGDGIFQKLENLLKHSKLPIFGYLSYDVKNEIEMLYSENTDAIKAPEYVFFEPRYLLSIEKDTLRINRPTLEAIAIKSEIDKEILPSSYQKMKVDWQSNFSKEEYIQTIEKIRQHIIVGDCYELNLCRNLSASVEEFDAVPIFNFINKQIKAPFSSFIKWEDIRVLSFSPERYVQVNKQVILGQPIKGTRPIGTNEKENNAIKNALLEDEKERAENVMIVDLTRNDFAKCAETGSVEVKELFGIYEFENIIQMISTITAKKRKDCSLIDVLKNTFPMGSMTGAPKVKVMELIEQYERSKRGIYSGAIGYISKETMDFSVVIRTLIFNAKSKQLSYHVGGAITFDSVPEKEWEETEVKANSVLKYL